MWTIAELHELMILSLVPHGALNGLRDFFHEVVVKIGHLIVVHYKPILVKKFEVLHLLLT